MRRDLNIYVSQLRLTFPQLISNTYRFPETPVIYIGAREEKTINRMHKRERAVGI